MIKNVGFTENRYFRIRISIYQLEKVYLRQGSYYKVAKHPVAQPEFFEQWANFACARKKRWAKWAGFLLMGQTKY